MKPGYVGKECKINYKNSKQEISFSLEAPIYLELGKTLHYTIIAKSGGGKSYLMRVLVEEELLNGQFSPIIFDPLGVFSTIQKPNKKISADWGIDPRGMENITIYSPGGVIEKTHPFHLCCNQITPATFSYAFDLDALEPQSNLYRKLYRTCYEHNPNFSLNEMREILLTNSDGWGYKWQTSEALLAKIETLFELGIIGKKGLKLDEIIRPTKGIVFDFSLSGTFESRIFVNFIAETILNLRRKINRKLKDLISEERAERINEYIPPCALFIDEAHEYIPKNPHLRQIVKEGRNIGIKLGAISQSVDLPDDLYANSSYFFIGPLSFDKDISKVSGLVPLCINPKMLKMNIKSLPTGCFFFFNGIKKSEEAKVIRIRESYSLHAASTEISDEKKHVLNYNHTQDSEYEETQVEQKSKEVEIVSDNEIRIIYEHLKFGMPGFTLLLQHELSGEIKVNTPKINGICKVTMSKKKRLHEISDEFLLFETGCKNKEEAVKKLTQTYPQIETDGVWLNRLVWKSKSNNGGVSA